ncbi:unnamed protein product [Paramecium pentaurelia]|uniref:Uncharacterized protein n=1 Tax=Paramecium pentaurelia TaxID=43138 RepID=A0A8S1T023_9CILI|nr:unnamed protein product [Paramecium pentaurelia]
MQYQRPKFQKNPQKNEEINNKNHQDSPELNKREPTTSQSAKAYNSQYNPQYQPPCLVSGSLMYVPMPPPANQATINQYFQQFYPNPEQYLDKQSISNNQNNLSATQKQSEILQIISTPQNDVQQKQQKQNEYVQSYIPDQEEQNLQNKSKPSILENFQIISTCKIKNMDLSSKTHNMIIVDKKFKEFIIQPFDENLKNKQLINSNLIIVQDKNITVPEFDSVQRLCQLHMKPIEKICTNYDCKQNNDILLCQDCARNHKGHNLYDIPEVLFLIQKNQKSLEDDENFMNILKCKTFSELKFFKSNIIGQLEEIENKLNDGFNIFQQKLFEKKNFYEQAFNEIQFGGLSKMIEQINNIYNQGVFQEVQQSSNDFLYKQLAQQLEQAKQSIQKFEQLIQQKPQDQVKIKINNIELLIQNQKIQNLNDLYFQIKIDALKQNITNILDQDILLFKKNKGIKLKGNNQLFNLKDQLDIEVISYLEI